MNRTHHGGLAAIIAAGFLFAVPAFADDQPICRGTNTEDCRPDPNEHGQDCDEHGQHDESNDDHCATTTSTSTTTTTLLLDLLSTTTTAPTTTTSPVPSVTIEPPHLDTPPATVAATTTTTAAPQVLSTHVDKLPTTGAPIAFYVAVGLLCLLLGAAARHVRRIGQ